MAGVVVLLIILGTRDIKKGKRKTKCNSQQQRNHDNNDDNADNDNDNNDEKGECQLKLLLQLKKYLKKCWQNKRTRLFVCLFAVARLLVGFLQFCLDYFFPFFFF